MLVFMRQPSSLHFPLGAAWLCAMSGLLFAYAPVPTGPHAAQGEQWEEGAALPALRLPTVDGQATIDLRRTLGKKLLLIEFASW